MSNAFRASGLTASSHGDELALIDAAVAASKEAAHACRSQAARDHFEFALALLRESWIAESGQESTKRGKGHRRRSMGLATDRGGLRQEESGQ